MSRLFSVLHRANDLAEEIEGLKISKATGGSEDQDQRYMFHWSVMLPAVISYGCQRLCANFCVNQD